MNDDELGQSLQAMYRAIDPRRAPQGLDARIGDALETRPSRPVFTARTRPAFAAAVAAVLIVAIGLGLRPGGFLTAPGGSPVASRLTATPSLTATPTPGFACASPAPSPSPSPSPSACGSAPASTEPAQTVTPPSGSMPPVSTAVWTGLQLQPLAGGPVGVSSVTAWAGGYLALGRQDYPAPTAAWISRDGRSWVELPADTFGTPALAQAAPCADGIVVATGSYTGETTVWHSTDGTAWTSSPAPQMRLSRDGDLAGNATGVVAILADTPYGLAFSPNGTTWAVASLPGDPGASVQAVTAFGTGFVAVGDIGSTTGLGQAPAWWSADGLQWSLAGVQAGPGNAFFDVHAAASGLIALSHDGGVPGSTSFWTSREGWVWAISPADPLGNVASGALGPGSGSNGLFSGDGTRLIGYGIRTANESPEYWTSLDGTHWTRLVLTGDSTATEPTPGGVTPFLLRNGVLFVGDKESWFGIPQK